MICDVYFNNRKLLRNEIISLIKSKEWDLEMDEEKTNYLQEFAEKKQISYNECKSIYYDIDPILLLKENYDSLFRPLECKITKCFECNVNMLNLNSNTNEIWKGNQICYECWMKHSNERSVLFNLIEKYKTKICYICNREKTNQNLKYHFDHINIFDKSNNICEMVSQGYCISDIYKEIDKCEVICFSCHHLITYCQSQMGFFKIKSNLSRKFNKNLLNEYEYESEINSLQLVYREKIINLKSHIIDFINRNRLYLQ